MSWRRFFSRSRDDAELTQEIELHLAEETDDNVACGMSPEEARRQAFLKFGNPQLVREDLWQQNTITAIDNFGRNSKYAIRTLLRTPGFTVIAILVMALGIGANAALFTIVRSVLLKPLPFKDPDRLVMLYENRPQDNKYPYKVVAPGIFGEWRKEAKSVEQMAILSPWKSYSVSGSGGALPEHINAAHCSWNLFSTLGVQPAYGRVFRPEDDRPEANATVVLSWSFLKRRFGGDKSIVYKDILLDAKPYTVIGVMPAWFAYPAASTQVWTPIYHETPESDMQALDNHMYKVVAGMIPMSGIGGERMLETLQESSRSHSGGESRARLRKVLLASEVGLTVVLLISAGLLLKSYQKLQSTELGCATDNVLTMGLNLPEVRYKEPVQKVAFFEQLLERVRNLPDVEAAGLVTCAPGGGWCGDDLVTVVEHPHKR